MSREDGYRLVHFDLKGAPPRLPYLQKILPLLKMWGVNGLLVEYEDMFPYEGELQVLARPEAYSKDNIQAIVELATENGMTVIPLVQTFGHMEFVLKHPKFAGLRESPEHCRSICPSNPESRRVVLAMLGQVLSLHPTARWVHIGADEVYHLGECDMCRQRMVAEGLTKERLFLSHVRSVAEAIKQMYPFTQLIMWDDMFRLFEALVIKDSGIGSLVEPMVWYYQPNDIPVPDLWERYSQVFPTVWLASAYKGATGVYQYATDATYHLGNHLMWLLVLERESAKFEHIRGVALTGWQRYDHFTVLCELLPAAIPSLGLCLETLDKGSFTTKVHEKVSSDLKCNGLLPLNPFQLPDIPECKFPGSDIYMMCSQLVHLDAQLEYKVLVQCRPQPVNIAGPDSTESTTTAQRLLDSYEDLGRKLTVSLSEVYFPHTVEEWLSVYINPKLARLKELL